MTEEEVIEKIMQRKEGFFERNKAYIIGAVLLAVGGWYMFGAGNSRNVNDGFADVERQLKNIEDQQRLSTERLERIESGISKSIGTVGAIRTEIGGVRETLSGARITLDGVRQRSEECNKRIEENDRAIANCESVIAGIEERNRQKNEKSRN